MTMADAPIGWWVALIVACLASYGLKLAGVSLPESLIATPVVQRVARYLPIAVLSALVVVELVDGGGRWAVDWRVLVAVGVAVIALLLKRGFLTVFVTAVVVCALLQLVPL